MKLPALLATAILATTIPAPAALIIWDAPQTITGDSDVNTTGTLNIAANLGPTGVSNTTINGVTFLGSDVPPFGTPTTTASIPLSSEYLLLLNTGYLIPADTAVPVGIGGLNIGDDYLIQIWVNNSGRTFFGDRGDYPTTISDPLGNSVSLYPGDNGIGTGPGNTNLAPLLGEYVIGRFKADATIQALNLFSAEIPSAINGLQVRNITGVAPSAVPEPGTALAGFVAVGLLGLRRRRG